MKILEFVWFCIKSMLDGFSATFGRVPEGYTWKNVLAGGLTFLILIGIFVLIGFKLKILEFKK